MNEGSWDLFDLIFFLYFVQVLFLIVVLVFYFGNIQFEESEDGFVNIVDFIFVEYILQVWYILIYIDNILFKYINVLLFCCNQWILIFVDLVDIFNNE